MKDSIIKIFKFQLDVGVNKIQCQIVGKPFAVQVQNGRICMWAYCDINSPNIGHCFTVLGTGFAIQTSLEDLQEYYIGTVQQERFVWHVYTGVII